MSELRYIKMRNNKREISGQFDAHGFVAAICLYAILLSAGLIGTARIFQFEHHILPVLLAACFVIILSTPVFLYSYYKKYYGARNDNLDECG